MSRPLTILYAGLGLSGRTESLSHLIRRPRTPDRPGESYEQCAAGFDWTFRGQTRRVQAHVLYTGSLWYPSLDATLRSPVALHREAAERVFEALPRIDGMVFVACGMRFRADANAQALATWLTELARVGVSAERLPVVFQLNRRDLIDALPLDDCYRALRTPRCEYAPAIAPRGLGVDEALAKLVAMIDGAAPAPVAASSAPGWRPRAADPPPTPEEITRLFQPSEHDVLPDRSCRERLVVVSPLTLEIASGSFMLAGRNERPHFVSTAPRGRHQVTLLQRVVEYDRPDGGVDQTAPATIALRVAFGSTKRTTTVTPIAGARRHGSHMVIGDQARGCTSLDVNRLQIQCVGPSAPNGTRVFFDVGLTNDPVRAYWERADDGEATAFRIFGDDGAALLGRRCGLMVRDRARSFAVRTGARATQRSPRSRANPKNVRLIRRKFAPRPPSRD